MTKRTGMGSLLLVDGNDISGDVNQISTLRMARNVWEVPGIDVSAMERVHTHRDASISLTSYFNDASNRAFPVLSSLPTTDRALTYVQRQAIGGAAFSMIGKQISYDGSRGADASLTFDTEAQSNLYGGEWGECLTAGKITVTGAGNQTGLDLEASTAFGLQAWIHVSAFTGTDATVSIEESSDNAVGDAYAAVTGGAFTQITGGAPFAERIQTGRTLTVERWLRVAVSTSAGFTSLTFTVAVRKNTVSTVFAS